MDCRMLSSKHVQPATVVTPLGLLLALRVVVCVFLLVYVGFYMLFING